MGAERTGDSRGIKVLKELYEWLEAIVFSLVVMFALFSFVFRTIQVYGISMQSTLHEGDRLILLSALYEPDYEDIVVVTQVVSNEDYPLIKRVIGLPGDEIDIDFQAGIVYRNGEVLDEPYINEPTHLYEGVNFPVTVPEGCVFVMGDNRNYSKDSRNPDVGMIDKKYLLGKVIFRIWPLSKL